MKPLIRFIWIIQLFAVLYATIAVLYATHVLLVSPLCKGLSLVFRYSSSWCLWPSFPSVYPSTETLLIDARLSSSPGIDVEWNSSKLSLEYSLGHAEPALIDGDLFLSKILANSMRPSKIIPFFYRATGTFDLEDVTITTLITSNRFQAFSRLVEKYEGPISVAIHVRNTPAHLRDLFDSLDALYTSSSAMATYVDVHLVIDSFDRQFNTWRNIARLFARTDFVLMLDIDFYICTDFRTTIKKSKRIIEKLQDGAAFVIPAFEYAKYAEGVNPATFPKDKQALLDLVKSKRIGMFHASWGPGHNSTDYKKLYASLPGEIYKVTQYQSAYEPYVIFKKEGPSWCDERFIGYGGNKAACLFEMYLSGVSYYVLADHFIVHQSHLYEEAIRKNERKYNRKVYSDFKEETCLRYLKSRHESNSLGSTRELSIPEECKKIFRLRLPDT